MLTDAAAWALDAADPLAAFSVEFHHPVDPGGRRLIYLAGHSSGLQPKTVAAQLQRELDEWRLKGVLGHHTAARPWIDYHEALAPPLAALAGASAAEVVAMNSLTVNLHLMLVSFFRPVGGRTKILIEQGAFPSDRYAVASQLAVHGLPPADHLLEARPRPGERTLRTEDLLEAIETAGSSLALVLLPGVQYLTGEALEVAPLIEAAHRVGARVGLDLAHAIGNTHLALHDWNADFAVWCSYKYLNAGPGAIGGCFVHERHGDAALPRFAGWWGQRKDTRFAMGPDFEPIPGAEGWQVSNPPILATAPLIASLDIFARAGFDRLRHKSRLLTGVFDRLVGQRLAGRARVITPDDPGRRGCQLSIVVERDAADARRVHQRLTGAGVIGDWREPDTLRLAPVPLYTSFADVFDAVDALDRALRP